MKSIEILIRAGADVNITDDTGHVPLIEVICLNHHKCLPFLLESGADVNTVDSKRGSSALKNAIRGNKWETMDQLLKSRS